VGHLRVVAVASALSTSGRRRTVFGVIAGLLGISLYAGQFVVTRWSIQRTLTLWDVAALRFAVAGALMLPLFVRYGVRDAAGIGWRRAIVVGITVGAPYTLVLFAGLTMAPAAHGAVIVSGGTPIMSALLLSLWFGEPLSPGRVTGLTSILIGLLLVGWPTLHDGGHGYVWIGDLLLLGASALWGTFTALTRRWHVDPLRGAAVVWVLALAYLPFYLVLAPMRLLTASRAEITFQATYQGIGVGILALFFYTYAARALGATAASLFMPLIPVVTVLLGIPVLAETPSPVQFAGIFVVSVGMVLATLSSARRR
jgi:drug/metabolite transporter (DMT)-like permease